MLEKLGAWTYDAIHDALIGLAQHLELKKRPYPVAGTHRPVRQAVTPGGAVELCQLLGRDESLRRIRRGIAQLTR